MANAPACELIKDLHRRRHCRSSVINGSSSLITGLERCDHLTTLHERQLCRTRDKREPSHARRPDERKSPCDGNSSCTLQTAGNVTLRNVYWLHIPKTNSAFQCTLLRATCGISQRLCHNDIDRSVQTLIAERCPSSFVRFLPGHAPLVPNIGLRPDSRAFMFVRNPSARATSGFFHELHDCFWMQEEVSKRQGWQTFYRELRLVDMRLYASCISACAVRMLTNLACGRCILLHRDTHKGAVEETDHNHSFDEPCIRDLRAAALDASHPLPQLGESVPQALANMRRFAFVGVQDKWDLSLKVFAHRFGQRLEGSDYHVIRKNNARATDVMHVARQMERFSFTDAPVYDEALTMLQAAGAQLDLGA
jgi:hypothetical protein